MKVRVVFLVHGVGSQKKGQFLETVLDPLLRFLRAYFASDVRATIHLRPANEPAHATIQLLDKRGNIDEHWEIKEVLWADSFYAQPAQRVLTWGFVALFRNLGNFAVGTIPFLRRLFGQRPTPPCGGPIYGLVPLTFRSRLYDLVVGTAGATVLVLGAVPLLLLATAFYILALLPGWLIFPSWLRRAVVGVVSYLVEGFGDQYALMYTQTAASSARQRLVDALSPYMAPRHPGHTRWDSATVIAHSGGSTVSFQVMSDPGNWRVWAGGSGPPMDMTLMTLGSSLNISWESVPEHPMWNNPLPKNIRWVDMWARYDPVSHGPACWKLIEKARGCAGEFCSVRVVNLDAPNADHDAYWGNHEEVVSRFVYEIAGRPVPPPAGQPPSTTGERIRAAVDDAIAKITSHRKRVGTVRLVQVGAVALMALVAGVFGGFFVYLGSLVADILPSVDTWPQPMETIVGWAKAVHSDAPEFLVGFVLFVLAVQALSRLVLLWWGTIIYRDPWG